MACCAVCMELYKDPDVLGCGHSFCAACIDDLSPMVCPVCREPFTGASRKPNFAFRDAQSAKPPGNPDAPRNTRIKICAIGETGAGKSSLCNALVGGGGRFPVSDRIDSCTFTTTACIERFLGLASNEFFTMVDTPGLNDSRPGADNRHLSQMTLQLMRLNHVNAICIVLNNTNCRLPRSTHTLMNLFARVFGGDYWKNVMFVYTHWAQDQRSKMRRGPDKEKTLEHDIKQLLMKPERDDGFGQPQHIVDKIKFFFVDTDPFGHEEQELMTKTLTDIQQAACGMAAFKTDASFISKLSPLNALEESCVAISTPGGAVELHGLDRPWLQDGDIKKRLKEEGKLDEIDSFLRAFAAGAFQFAVFTAVLGAAAQGAISAAFYGAAAIVGPVGWATAGTVTAAAATVGHMYTVDLHMTIYITNLLDMAVFLVGVDKSDDSTIRAPRVIPSLGTGVAVFSGNSFDCRLDYKTIEDVTFSIYGGCSGSVSRTLGAPGGQTFAVRKDHQRGKKACDFQFERENETDTFSAFGTHNAEGYIAVVHFKPREAAYKELLEKAAGNAKLVRAGQGERNAQFKVHDKGNLAQFEG